MIEQSIYAIGQASAGLATLLGSGANMKLFPEAEEQEHATPRVVFSLVEASTVSGIVQDSAWRHTRYVFTCYGATASEAKQLREQVYTTFARYNGTIGGHTIDPGGFDSVTRIEPGGYDFDLQQFYEEIEIPFFHN